MRPRDQVSLIRIKPSSNDNLICNVPYIFPCMSKSMLERVDALLKTQLEKKKRDRQWRVIQSCLRYWAQYGIIVKIWLESKNLQVIRNGKQLFEFLVGLRPGWNGVQLLKSMTNREAFLEVPLIMFCESIFSLLQVHGRGKIFHVSDTQKCSGALDWDDDVEDEEQLILRLDQQLGTFSFK